MTSSRLNPSPSARWVFALLFGAAVGCSRNDAKTPTAIQPHGPHGGHTALMSVDTGFAMEFTLDERRRRMVIYVQESDGPKPYPLAADSLSGRFEAGGQDTEVTFAADPRPEDPQGRASRFALPLDAIPQQLLASAEFVLKLSCAENGAAAVTATIPHKDDHAHEYHHD